MILFIVLALIILGFIFFKLMSREHMVEEYECVCAFDVDDTITSESKTAKDVHTRAINAIQQCKENNCKIVINTARMPISNKKWDIIRDLPDKVKEHIESEEDIYHGETLPQCSFIGYDCLYNQIAETKVKHLKNVAQKYNIDHKKIILFDDLYQNIKKASEHGFSVVHANYPGIDPKFKLEI